MSLFETASPPTASTAPVDRPRSRLLEQAPSPTHLDWA
jgi:hypothetical protein